MKKWFNILIISITIFFIFLFMLSLVFRYQITGILNDNFENYGLLGLFFGSLILELVPQWIAPQLFVFSSAIWGLPFLPSLFSLYFGSVVGSMLGFEIGKKYKDAHLNDYLKEKTKERVKKFVDKWGNFGLVLTAISPLPYFPIVFGALYIKRRNFIMYGVIPRFFFFFYVALIAYNVF